MALFPLPHASRSQVFTALFNILKASTIPGIGAWKTVSQKLVIWDEVDSANQPALFLYRAPQTAAQAHVFGVTKWQWRLSIWIYFRTDCYKDSKNGYPDQLTDQILDAIEQTFQTDPLDGRFTLGNLVHHCWIDGNCVSEPGLVDGQGLVIVPISILL